jgi:tetratricopeptide (TPR) repeat protein
LRLRDFVIAHAAWERIDEANLLLGSELVLSGEVAAGKDVLERLIAKAPDGPHVAAANYYIGMALEGLGDFPGAVLTYDIVFKRFPKSPLAPEAALREIVISEGVLQNVKRAREICEGFIQNYPDLPSAAAVRNHLGLLAERGTGQKRQPTRAEFMQDWYIVGGFPNPDGKGFDTAYAPETRVDLEAKYDGLGGEKVGWMKVPDGAKLGDGGINLLAALKPTENVTGYAYTVVQSPDDRSATLYIGSDDSAKVWVNGKLVLARNVSRGAAPDQDHAPIELKKGDNAFLLKVCNGTGGWGFYCRIDYDYAWGPAAAVRFYRDYAAKHPADVGDPALNGDVAGAAAAMWRAAEISAKALNDVATAVEIYKQYAGLPRANKAEGYMAAARLLAAQPAVGDARPLFEAALNANPRDDWRLEFARWLKGTGKENDAAAQFAMVVEKSQNWALASDALNLLGPERVKAYLDGHPTDLAVFRHYLSWFKDGEKRIEGRKVLDQWLARQDIDWKTTIAGEWAKLTGEAEDLARLVRAADVEGQMSASTSVTLALADKYVAAKATDEARKALVAGLDTWSAYPDFPAGEFARRLAGIARLQPLMVPNQKKLDAKAAGGDAAAAVANEPDNVPNPAALPARRDAVELIRKYRLNAHAVGAHELALLQAEIDPKAAVEDAAIAATLLLQSGMLNEAIVQIAWLAKESPADPRFADVLYQASLRGPKGWEKQWNEIVLPAATDAMKHLAAVNPQTEASRLARTKLARFFDAKQSVAIHEEFLKNHPNSANAPAVQEALFGEMRRAGTDPAPAVLQAIKDAEKNPRLVLGIPLEMIPAGPTGYDLFVANVQKALPGADANMAPQLLLKLGRVHARFGDAASAFAAFKQVGERYGNSPYSKEAKQEAVVLFRAGFFAPGVSQKDIETAWAWQMESALAEGVETFDSLTDTLWRIACNPAYRLHDLEDVDALYMYSTHQHAQWPPSVGEFLAAVYDTYPGDGIGPADKVENQASPFRPGDRFMLYRWGLLRAPTDGYYNFWFGGDDYVGIEIDGRAYNIPNANQGQAGVYLTRGLHLMRIIYGDWGGGYSMSADWQAPGWQRLRLGPEAFSAEMYPLIMDEAVANQGAFGLAQWEAYVQKYPRDARGRMMRIETMALADPNRAVGELTALANKYPDNLHYRERLANCLWRLGRYDEALKHYGMLAAARADTLWDCGDNSAWKRYFLRDRTPLAFSEEYEDRVRARGDWQLWLARAVQSSGEDGAVAARVAASEHLNVLEAQARLRLEAAGRVTAAIEKEKARIEAAKALAAKQDAEEGVKAQARAAIARAERRIAELTPQIQIVQQRAQVAQNAVNALRGALGLRPDQPAEELYVSFARANLDKRTISPATIYNLAVSLWNRQDKEAVMPFLEYVVRYATDRNQVRWCMDRLVELAVAGKDVAPAALALSQVGWRAPADSYYAEYLKRACDMALESGQVYMFARNAHALARLHGNNPQLSGYLDRLGAVFEKAGNYRSAEQEYKRVAMTVKDPARVRMAQISLARMYEKQGRSQEALGVLSKLVAITMPEQDKKMGKPAAGAPRGAVPKEANPGGNPGGNPGNNPGNNPGEGAAAPPAEVKPEDTEALLLATRCYLSLDLSHLALDAYERAARQQDFGNPVRPEKELLMDLARSCIEGRSYTARSEGADDSKLKALPLDVLARADKALKIVDTLFRFYGDKMTPKEKVDALLVRADANILMRNFPRAIEEIRAAKAAAGDSPAALLADLKMARCTWLRTTLTRPYRSSRSWPG